MDLGDGPIAITGATGWLGRATLDLLAGALGPEAFGVRVRAYARTPREISLSDGTPIEVRALDRLPAEPPADGLLAHFAYRTREQAAEAGLGTYVQDNVAITATVVAAVRAGAPAGILLPSSGAIYDRPERRLATDLETNPYGTLKHLDELAFTGLCSERGVRLVVARVFNVSGPPMIKPQGYALGSLICAALAGEPLVVRATRPVRRSYVAISELVRVALARLVDLEAPPMTTFDTADQEVVEMGELADRVRRALGRDDLDVVREAFNPDAPADDYVGDPAALAELAERYGVALTPLDEQIRATAEGLGSRIRPGGRY